MFGSKVKEICGHKFEIVKKGLLEKQVRPLGIVESIASNQSFGDSARR